MLRMTDLQARPQGWVPDVSTFGARLALVRQRMGWTNIKEAAEQCAIAPQTWRQWESDKFVPRQLVNACIKIAGVTGVDYRWLALGPADQAPTAAQPMAATSAAQGGSTPEYSVALGERVVAVGSKSNISSIRTLVRIGLRTKPVRR